MKIKIDSIKLIALILFSFFSIYNNAMWGASFSYVLLPFLMFLLVLLYDKTSVKKNVLFIFVIYLIYFISTLFSDYVEIGREFISLAFFCFFFVIAATLYYSTKELKLFIISYIIIAFSVSCNICFQWLNHSYIQPWLQRSSFYFMGHFKDPNYVFAFISPAIILAVMILFNSKNFKIKLLMSVNLGVSFFACMIASSRAGMLSIVVSIGMMILLSKNIKVSTKMKLLIFSIGVIVAARWYILNNYNDYALNRMFNDTEGGGRFDIWSSALEVFINNPLLGGGLNSGSAVSVISTGYPTHSILIDIICDSGLVGLVAWIIFVVNNCIRSNRNNIEFQVVLSFACFIPMLFINGFNTTTFFYPLIMLSIFSRYLERNNYLSLVDFSVHKNCEVMGER